MEINYDRIMVPPPPAKKRQTGREDETDLAGVPFYDVLTVSDLIKIFFPIKNNFSEIIIKVFFGDMLKNGLFLFN